MAGDKGSDSSSTPTIRWRAFITIATYRVPGAKRLSAYCTDAGSCDCLPDPPSADTGDSDSASGDDTGCEGSWNNFDITNGCVPPDPNVPPAWWLLTKGAFLAQVCSTFGGIACDQSALMICVGNGGTPPTATDPGSCTLATYATWLSILALWQAYLRSNPGVFDALCLGVDPAQTESTQTPFLRMQRWRFPPGTRLISRRCVEVDIDPVCAPCQS